MESMLTNDLLVANAPEPDALLPNQRSKILTSGGKLLYGAAALGLLLLALAGLWMLMPAEGGTPWTFSLAAFMVFGALLALAVLTGAAVRAFERSWLGTGYQTRLEQLQRRLNYREDLLRLVADHQSRAMAIFDRHNRYWFVNQSAAQSIGKPPSEIIGRPPIKVLSDEKAKRLEVRLAEARAADQPIECIDRVVDEKGNTRFVQMHYAATSFAEQTGSVLVSEEDLTSLIVEREKRERMLRQVIETLVAVVDRRDPYAAGHSSRVGQLAREIALEMGMDSQQAEAAEISGSLMNFGKVLVSRRILTKTSALTPEELQRVREAILTSADILAIIGFEGPVVPTLRQVMERYDGTGAPHGLKGEDILLMARIVSVANAFVALVSPRAHRDGLSLKEAMRSIMTDSGKAFDERVLIALNHYIENCPNKLDWLMATRQEPAA
ncbi:MAG: PAS domain-containing protein [Alphaproteobacteria bacterium]|nr:PAS domain-containing protein [Alphaproteobacteria bacterium]